MRQVESNRSMAVTFCYGLDVLLNDLKRCGYSAELVETCEVGRRVVTAKIRVEKSTALNWDRDSLTVWAEGPTRLVRKVERSLRFRGHGGILERFTRKRLRLVASLILPVTACLTIIWWLNQ